MLTVATGGMPGAASTATASVTFFDLLEALDGPGSGREASRFRPRGFDNVLLLFERDLEAF